MIDLSTTYLGLTLRSPLVASSSPMTESVESLMRLEDAGAAAVVLPSIFEEQLALESLALDRDLSRGTESFAESLSYFPEQADYKQGSEHYLELIHQAKKACTMPVVASLNGATPGGWVRFAQEIEKAGADALELNTYLPATRLNATAASIEERLIMLVRKVKQATRIPVAVKLSQQFTSLPHVAMELDSAGADGLVLFNRFYQPDFDIEVLDVRPRLVLSRPEELLPRLHAVGILYGDVRAGLAVTGGVHRAEDVLKCMMAGAQVAMMASVLLAKGAEHIRAVELDLVRWMEEHEYESVRQMRGSLSRRAVTDPGVFERGNYIKTLSSYTLRGADTGVSH
ncbi:MAG TPA: dihydroorotate dehydrogenase-like protein [Acidobacteriaceae bacterium]|nr:dihydroorotate dehydrogenase-like protein [Acidobacteriaceae bacterium]